MAGSLVARELTSAPPDGVALATTADEAELRALLRRVVMPGAVRVAFTREPRYAAGDGIAGGDDFTVVARRDGRVVGLGRLAVRRHYRNGEVQRIGYLGELRTAPETPERPRAIRDGFARLAEVTAGARLDACFTSIATDNVRARRVLENGGRFGLPLYRPLADLVTLVAPVPSGTSTAGHAAARRGGDTDREELAAFLRHGAREAHLTLTWDDALWAALARHGVTPADFCIVYRQGRIVSAAAVWDQRPFRQTVVDGYDAFLRLTRPLVNAVQALRGLPLLPPPGTVLPQGMVLGATASDDWAWSALWDALRARAAALGISWLACSADRRAPELPSLRRLLRPREYHTRIYDVAWRGHETRGSWDDRLFRPEVGLL